MPLFSLLSGNQHAKCVDVRDKIFGLHSFAPSCCRAANPVDYTCSAWVLCNRLLEHHYRYHEYFQSEFSIIDKSEVLHRLLIPGALEQNVSHTIFPAVGPEERSTTGKILASENIADYRYTEIVCPLFFRNPFSSVRLHGAGKVKTG
jgi:hypothetical protein